eukprot:4088119-Pleurochrysis_carterae.AAC.1
MGAYLQTGSQGHDGAVYFDGLEAYRAGGPDATPTPAQDARPALSPSNRPLDPTPQALLAEIRLRGGGGWGKLLARLLARRCRHRACVARGHDIYGTSLVGTCVSSTLGDFLRGPVCCAQEGPPMITYQDFGRGSAGGFVNGAAAWRLWGIGVSSPGRVRGKSVVGAAGIVK